MPVSKNDKPNINKPIFLIGPTHVGKSYHGRALSKHFNCSLIDVDKAIEDNAGVDIPTIFDFEGEDGFRHREHQALIAIDEHHLSIVSTGAGIILSEDNRSYLKKGVVIYLNASIDLLFSRVKQKTDRPLFKNKNPRQVLEQMHQIRAPLYEQCADYQVFIERQSHSTKVMADMIEFINQT